MCGRGTSNSNERGNTRTRRQRRQWLLDTYGNGKTAPCYRCGEELDDSTVQADRIIAGMDGGTYERGNIRPACGPCNIATGNQLREHRKRFPLGAPVRFRGQLTAYDVVGGESEALLTLRSIVSGRRVFNVHREQVEPLPAHRPALHWQQLVTA